MDESAFGPDTYSGELALYDRTRDKVAKYRSFRPTLPLGRGDRTHFIKFLHAYNKNIHDFAVLLQSSSSSSSLNEKGDGESNHLPQDGFDWLSQMADDITFLVNKAQRHRLTCLTRRHVSLCESHYRSSSEQADWERKHDKVFNEVLRTGLRFHHEKFLPEHAEHWKKYCEVHTTNLEKMRMLCSE